MKVIYFNCGWRREYESDLHSNQHYLSRSENKAWKNSGLYGIWTHDLSDTGQRSTNWANKPTGSSSLSSRVYLVKKKRFKNVEKTL